MEEIVALIDRLIDEHKVIIADARSLEQVANDASLLAEWGTGLPPVGSQCP